MTDPSALVTALERAGHRLTEPRRALAALIEAQPGHFTAAGLAEQARARRMGVGRATIFRTLDLLGELGYVERIDLPDGEHAWLACQPLHHHHVVCTRCGRADEVEDAGLRRLLGDVTQRTGFRIESHRLELFGLCPSCLATAPAPAERSA